MIGRVFRLAAMTMAVGVAGCVSVDVPEGAFFWPDARLAHENIVLEPDPAPPGSENLPLTYAHGVIGATRVRSSGPGRPLILYCGGNMFRREAAGGSAARKLASFGDVLMFDYPGYGDTEGPTDFSSFRAVGEAVVNAARTQADAEGRPLIAWGHSLGGVVCAEAARHARADVLVLETTTPGAKATVDQQAGLMRPFVRVNMAPALAAVDLPASLDGYAGRIVVLEAGRDETLPPVLSQRLTRELRHRGHVVERLVFPEAGHNTVGRQPDFNERVSAALAAALAGR
ncbi:alpha/beta hydrolase family protein [Brevundimonas sp.]|uniref:alpha/beta hydrolase family protein n=1 Tax=Brevundimonas sp. TaxID=1871086 RepID=UPI002D2ACB1B|nr:alpha/beta hydrolase family protein [Brevundimonas sp.]HYC99521.1 alpha/beta hydrolase family protein [Brevundimonas sp.]